MKKANILNTKYKIRRRRTIITLIGLGLIVIMLPLVFLKLFTPSSSEAAWFDDSYAYRQKVTITGSADTNKKVKLDVDTATLTTAKLQADCDDIRFTDQNGSLLRFHLDSANGACDTNSTDYYILVPTYYSPTTILYIYYGNPNALNANEGTNFSEDTYSSSGVTFGSEEKGQGPVAFLKLDESQGTTAYDASANNNPGTITGGVWKSKNMCIHEACLQLDGSDDVIDIAYSGSVDEEVGLQDGFTYQVWVRPNGDEGYVVYKEENTWLQITSLSNGLFDLEASLNLSTTDATVTIPDIIKDQQWNLIGFSYTNDNDDEITVWVNGQAVGTSSDGEGSPTHD